MGKVILITGCSSGFGNLTARTLAEEGNTVYALMRNVGTKNAVNAAKLVNWANENKYNLKVIEMDVTDVQSVNMVIDEILHTEKNIDVLVNNAGVGGVGITEDFTIELVKLHFETNVFGVFNVTKAVIPSMRKAGRGLIVTISSGLGRIVIPLLSVYSSSKFAVEAMAEGWRYELAPVGIDSVIIEPGTFPTTNFVNNSASFSPQPSDRIHEYGALQHFTEGFFANIEESIKTGKVNDPQDVANTVKLLVNMPEGKRPLRTTVDKSGVLDIDQLNHETDEIESNLLRAFQLV